MNSLAILINFPIFNNKSDICKIVGEKVFFKKPAKMVFIIKNTLEEWPGIMSSAHIFELNGQGSTVIAVNEPDFSVMCESKTSCLKFIWF